MKVKANICTGLGLFLLLSTITIATPVATLEGSRHGGRAFENEVASEPKNSHARLAAVEESNVASEQPGDHAVNGVQPPPGSWPDDPEAWPVAWPSTAEADLLTATQSPDDNAWIDTLQPPGSWLDEDASEAMTDDDRWMAGVVAGSRAYQLAADRSQFLANVLAWSSNSVGSRNPRLRGFYFGCQWAHATRDATVMPNHKGLVDIGGASGDNPGDDDESDIESLSGSRGTSVAVSVTDGPHLPTEDTPEDTAWIAGLSAGYYASRQGRSLPTQSTEAPADFAGTESVANAWLRGAKCGYSLEQMPHDMSAYRIDYALLHGARAGYRSYLRGPEQLGRGVGESLFVHDWRIAYRHARNAAEEYDQAHGRPVARNWAVRMRHPMPGPGATANP